MNRATMPEAPVDKDGYSPLPKHKVGPSRKVGVPSPTCDVMLPEQAYQFKFRALIAAAADFRHEAGASRL